MQRRVLGVLVFLLAMQVSFSQSMKEIVSDQFDRIVSLPMKDKEFTISAFLGSRVYVLQQAKDSLSACCYTTTTGSETIIGVCSILVNDDSSFVKAVQALFAEIKQSHRYQAYTKESLDNGNFFLTFNDRNKLQMCSRKEASPEEQKKINYILGRLGGYSFIPVKGHGKRVSALDITNLTGLLKYIK